MTARRRSRFSMDSAIDVVLVIAILGGVWGLRGAMGDMTGEIKALTTKVTGIEKDVDELKVSVEALRRKVEDE